MGRNRATTWRDRIVGVHDRLPLLNGTLAPYIHLDNAATTPPLREAVEAIAAFLPYYASVHRGAGFKSRVSTAAYEAARSTIGRFVGASPTDDVVILGKNTTEAINKLAYRYPLFRNSIVISTAMEHHSNDLPWRSRATVIRAAVTPSGRLDEDDFDRLLALHAGRVAMVTVSGASNVTGFVQPIHRLARKAHAVGARILVDAAQLAPHRRIDMLPHGHPEHLDFVALSAHKMYAPFGTGALVGRREVFLTGAPEYSGGGTVEIVTPTDVHWAGVPDREEAGSPNVVGAIAMAAAAAALMAHDMKVVAGHEVRLTRYALERCRALPGVTLYGEGELAADRDRVGVLTFNVENVHHGLVAAVLGYEAGIGVRSGCFCAQPYVMHLLGLSHEEQSAFHRAHLAGRRAARPGMVRVSIGVHNTMNDVDALADALERVIRRDYRGHYAQMPNGDFVPRGHTDSIRSFLPSDRSALMNTH